MLDLAVQEVYGRDMNSTRPVRQSAPTNAPAREQARGLVNPAVAYFVYNAAGERVPVMR